MIKDQGPSTSAGPQCRYYLCYSNRPGPAGQQERSPQQLSASQILPVEPVYRCFYRAECQFLGIPSACIGLLVEGQERHSLLWLLQAFAGPHSF